MTDTIVQNLQPGDAVSAMPGTPPTACFIARTSHPLWPMLELVVWRMRDGSWSHDALDASQVVGDVAPTGFRVRTERLKAALLGTTGDWTRVPT